MEIGKPDQQTNGSITQAARMSKGKAKTLAQPCSSAEHQPEMQRAGA